MVHNQHYVGLLTKGEEKVLFQQHWPLDISQPQGKPIKCKAKRPPRARGADTVSQKHLKCVYFTLQIGKIFTKMQHHYSASLHKSGKIPNVSFTLKVG